MTSPTMPRAAVLVLVCLLGSGACDGASGPATTSPLVSPSTSFALPSPPPSTSPSPRSGRLVLAFACGRFICRSAPDGRGRRRLTGGRQADDHDPSWSPDGTQIVFSRTSGGGRSSLLVMNADGTGLRALTTDPFSETQPEWSPDGKSIAFTSDRDGNQEIYVVNADGTDAVDLSRNAGKDFGPTWSFDGKRIAYTSTRDGKPEVYVVEADGSRTTRLTISEGSSSPTWSPGETQVVLVAVGIGLALVDLKSGTVSPITTEATDSHPRWSPTGDLIAFQRGKAGRAAIYTVRPDGKSLRQVTKGPEADVDPAWGLLPA